MTPVIFAAASKHLSSIKIRRQWIGFIAAALLILFLPLPLPVSNPVDRVILVEASMFQFSPAEITVNAGDRVTIELVATDVVHGFSIDGYDFNLTAEPGQTVSKTFVADHSGSFRFRCSVACGNLHPFMIGKLQVGQNSLFLRAIALGILAVAAGMWTLHSSARKASKPTEPIGMSAG
jgi:heme/copper-type cytochrome/quinol oxidase subunit 2